MKLARCVVNPINSNAPRWSPDKFVLTPRIYAVLGIHLYLNYGFGSFEHTSIDATLLKKMGFHLGQLYFVSFKILKFYVILILRLVCMNVFILV